MLPLSLARFGQKFCHITATHNLRRPQCQGRERPLALQAVPETSGKGLRMQIFTSRNTGFGLRLIQELHQAVSTTAQATMSCMVQE